jgi:hypothetical protein
MPNPYDFGGLFEADELVTQVAILRRLVHDAAEKDPAALQLLLSVLPGVESLLADVQSALASRN